MSPPLKRLAKKSDNLDKFETDSSELSDDNDNDKLNEFVDRNNFGEKDTPLNDKCESHSDHDEVGSDEDDEEQNDENEEDYSSNIPEIVLEKIRSDDVTFLAKLVHASATNKRGKRKREGDASTDITTPYQLLLFAVALGSYSCVDFLTKLRYDNIDTMLQSDVWNARDTGTRPDVSVVVDLSAASRTPMHSLSKGRYITNEGLSSPVTVALDKHQLGVLRLLCSRFPEHALNVLGRPPPDEIDDDSPEENVSTMFALAGSEDETSLPIALVAIDDALCPTKQRQMPLKSEKVIAAILKRCADGSTILHWAAEGGRLLLVQSLLELLPDLIDSTDNQQSTVLHSASTSKCLDIVKCLLQRRPEQAFAKDVSGWSPFLYAIRLDSPDCAMAFLNGSSNDNGSSTALLHLSALGDLLVKKQWDEGIRSVLESLASVPEFYRALNDLVKDDPGLIRSTGKLAFVTEFPFLLSLHNKLLLARQKIAELSEHTDNIMDKYPILGSDFTVGRVCLSRAATWSSFVDFIRGYRSNTGEQRSRRDGNGGSNDILPALCKAILALRSRVILQFEEETGVGKGVEREVLGAISRDLTSGDDSGSGSGDAHISQTDRSSTSSSTTSTSLFTALDDGGQTYAPRQLPSPSRKTTVIGKGLGRGLGLEGDYDDAYDEAMTDFGVFGLLVAQLLLRAICNPRLGDEEAAGGQDVLSFNVTPVFWKLVLHVKVERGDLAGLDAMLFQNLTFLLETDNVEDLSLTFTAAGHDASSSGGVTETVVELAKGGASKAVTDRNKERYVDLLTRHMTSGRMQAQADLVRAGLLKILPPSCLELFSAAEIGQLLGGSTDVNVDDWMQHTENVGWSPGSSVVQWFWRLVRGLGRDERGLLLRFCTGGARLPTGGFAQLHPRFTISRVAFDEARALPTASTCFNLLKLPDYHSEAALKRNVMTAILLGSEGFSFS
eukprot:gene11019-23021_t